MYKGHGTDLNYQKIAFEEELYKELGLPRKSLFDILKNKKEEHILTGFEFSAPCKYKRDDDILFVTRKLGFAKQFAVVHLTWKGKMGIAGFPKTYFFSDFNEFKYLRMYQDITN